MVFVIEFMDSINKNNNFKKMPCKIILLNIIKYFIGHENVNSEHSDALSQQFI